jgi:type I restriction enzyme S subunit
MVALTEWKTLPIKELYDGLYDGPHATPKPSDSGPVFLGIKNVTDDGSLDLTEIRHIAEEDYASWTRRVEPRTNDLVFTYEATLNRYALIPPGFRGCLGRRMALIRTDPLKVDVRFLLYYFFTEEWRAVIQRNMLTGATVDRIPLTTFPDFPVRVPPLTVQQHIAGILSAYDELIENSQRRIKILESMARALYREWFVHSPDVLLWPQKALGDLITFKRGYDLPERLRRPGSVPIVSSSGVTGNHDQCKVLGPGLVTGRYGTLGEVHLVWESFWPLNTSLYVVDFHDTPLLYAYWLLQDVLKGQSGSAAAVPGLNRNHLHQLAVAAPPQEITHRFHSVVEPMAVQTRALQHQIQNLLRTRDLLLPRLLSGQVALSGN